MIRKVNIFLGVFLAGFILTMGIYSTNIHGEISSGLIRLHVLANSDLGLDQARKFAVKQAVLEAASEWLVLDGSLDEARKMLESRLSCISAIAEDISGHRAEAKLVREFFPARTYKGFTLPAGVYETLQISLGEARGRNWWCVLFPPLCLVDAVTGLEGGELTLLGGVLSAEAYSIVSEPENVRFRFKAVTLWQEFVNLFR